MSLGEDPHHPAQSHRARLLAVPDVHRPLGHAGPAEDARTLFVRQQDVRGYHSRGDTRAGAVGHQCKCIADLLSEHNPMHQN